MKQDQHYVVIKPIPLGGEKYIPKELYGNKLVDFAFAPVQQPQAAKK